MDVHRHVRVPRCELGDEGVERHVLVVGLGHRRVLVVGLGHDDEEQEGGAGGMNRDHPSERPNAAWDLRSHMHSDTTSF